MGDDHFTSQSRSACSSWACSSHPKVLKSRIAVAWESPSSEKVAVSRDSRELGRLLKYIPKLENEININRLKWWNRKFENEMQTSAAWKCGIGLGVHAGLLGAFEILQFNQEEPDAPPAALTDSPAYDNYLVYHLLEKWGWGETSSVKLQQECLQSYKDQVQNLKFHAYQARNLKSYCRIWVNGID